jgi:hypothetical protein
LTAACCSLLDDFFYSTDDSHEGDRVEQTLFYFFLDDPRSFSPIGTVIFIKYIGLHIRLSRGRSSRRMGNYCLECPDRIIAKRIRTKGFICGDCVIRTGRPNPPHRTEEETPNRKPQPICRKVRTEAIAFYVPTTVEENAAYITGKAAFDEKFRRFRFVSRKEGNHQCCRSLQSFVGEFQT